MTYRYAVISGALIGIWGGLFVEILMYLTYRGYFELSALGFVLLVLPLLGFVIVGRWQLARESGRTSTRATRGRVMAALSAWTSTSTRAYRYSHMAVPRTSRLLMARPQADLLRTLQASSLATTQATSNGVAREP